MNKPLACTQSLISVVCSLFTATVVLSPLCAQTCDNDSIVVTRNLTTIGRIVTTDSLTDPLDSLYRALPEVMITGERPLVKAEQGKLIYDLPRLIRKHPVDNAYDAVKELPGVFELNGSLMLGGQSVTVILDGKSHTFTSEQLTALLQRIPADRIERAEVMYNAPARYQVRGALIDLRLKRPDSERVTLQGEAYIQYRQTHEAAYTERAALLFGNRSLSFDFLYAHSHGRHYSTTGKEALHSLNDATVHSLTTCETRHLQGRKHDLRMGADCRIAEDHRLSLVYTGRYNTNHSATNVCGTLQSIALHDSPDHLHNTRLDYQSPWGINAGLESTLYRSPSDQLLQSTLDENTFRFHTEDCQRITLWKTFLTAEHKLPRDWNLNYGVTYTTATDRSYQRYLSFDLSADLPSDLSTLTGTCIALADNLSADLRNFSIDTGNLPADMSSRRRESTLNLYAGFSKNLGDKLSLDASLAMEHYTTPTWNRWDCYPSLNLSYTPSTGHLLQLSLNGDKDYPDYWAVQNAVSYLSSYSEIHGNPLLRPSREYQLQFTYILRSKYLFTAWFTHEKDHLTQTLYQSPQRLVEIYKHLNFDFQRQAGVQASLPLSVKRILDARLTLLGVWHHEKDRDFYDLPFSRRICYGIALLNTTFTLSTRPDLKLTLKGMIRSKATQGIYDLPASGNLDIALRYAFAGNKAVLHVYCKDLFETGQISPRIRFHTQHVTNRYSCFRELGISFTYKFGGYKEKKREEVDTSRFR